MNRDKIWSLLSGLKSEGIFISPDGEGQNLVLQGNLQNLTELRKEDIREHKKELLFLLSSEKFSAHEQIKAAPVQASYPLTSPQKRIWTLSRQPDANVAYNIPGSYLFEGSLDITTLEQALLILVERHEILRTVFREDETGEVRQWIIEPTQAGAHIQYADLRNTSDVEQTVASLAQQNTILPFDLESGPLMRVSLLHVADERYILLYAMHHIISDLWSIKVLLKEIINVYNARQKHYRLEPLRIQFKDFAVWQTAQLSGAKLEQCRAYWLKQFEGDIPALQLPADRPRPAIKTYNGASIESVIDRELTSRLRRAAIDSGATLFVCLLAATKALLHKYSGQDDIIVASPISGREHSDLENQIGFYSNTLALRTRICDTDSYHELVRTVHATIIEGSEHQLYPMEDLITGLKLERDLSRNPLFDVMVVFQEADGQSDQKLAEGLDGIRIVPFTEVRQETSKFDLTFIFAATFKEIQLSIIYNSDLYSADRITRMTGHFLQLLGQMVSKPACPLSQLSFLTKAEKDSVLTESMGEDHKLSNETVVSLFEKKVCEDGQAIAVACEDINFTYQYINERANKLAHELQTRFKVKHGDAIGVSMKRSEYLLIGILAILKTGAIFVPVESSLPDGLKRYMLEDSQVRVLLTCLRSLPGIDYYNGPVIPVDEQLTYIQGPSTNPAHITEPGDSAYIIYTSGSTGQPKGVEVTHRSLGNYLTWANEYYFDNSKGFPFAFCTSISFDLTITSLFTPLLRGDVVHILPDMDVASVLTSAFNAGSPVRCVKLTPSHVLMLNELPLYSSDVGIAILGGEAVTREHIAILRRLNPDMKIYNEYGPTEATVGCVAMDADADMSDHFMTIGRPVHNTYVYILDQHMNMQPPGFQGEMWIGGACLAKGYHRKPSLTNERFKEDPFRPGKLIYKTGDLGRYRQDSVLEYLGRVDRQVKIRGHRIELGAIEAVLESMDGITQSVLTIKEHNREKQLIAYVVADGYYDSGGIMEALKERLPEYMIPVKLVPVMSFPLTANGKIDLHALSDETLISGANARVAPRNDIEEKIAGLWSKILETDESEISVKDDFFRVGGHSLTLMQLINDVYKEFNVKLKFADLFNNRVLEEQALLVGQLQKQAYTSIPVFAVSTSYPVSPSQRRLWVLSKFPEANAAYTISAAFELNGQLDITALENAFNGLIERHEILRTVFSDSEGEIRQFIRPAGETSIRLIGKDFRKESIINKDSILTEGFSDLDLMQGPLFMPVLICLEENRHILVCHMHHIISDGWSVNVMIRDIIALYDACCKGTRSPLAPLPVQHKDYTAWLNQQLQGSSLNAHRDYWMKMFEGELPVLQLPEDNTRPAIKTYNGSGLSRTINKDLAAAIKAFSYKQDASLFIGLLAAVKALLYRYSGQDDIIVGTPVATRQHPELHDQIGFYVNMLGLRTKFDGTESFSQLLAKIKDVVLTAYGHQIYPFDDLVDVLKRRYDLSRHPLFDVIVMLQLADNNTILEEGLADLTIKPFNNEKRPETSKFDLSFNFVEASEELTLFVTYNTDIYNGETVARLAEHFEQLLTVLTRHPDTPINKLEYLTASERFQQLQEFNNTTVPYRKDKTIIHLLEEQVAARPFSTALIAGDTNLTYLGLSERSNQLANYLINVCAITPGQIVALKLHRTYLMPVAILAVLKARAAYVPIDPSYPVGRISYMLADSGASALIVDESSDCDITLIDLQRDKAHIERQSVILSNDTAPDDLAYVIYTSGTTGNPKGVMITHGSLVNFLLSMRDLLKISDNCTLLSVTTFSFDIFGLELYLPLLAGGKVILPDRESINDITELRRLLISNSVTLMQATPSRWQLLIDSGWQNEERLTILTGGDAISESLKNSLIPLSDEPVWNLYGPTETTIWSTIARLSISQKVNIGRPIANTRIYILNPEMQLCPIGVSGELCIAGDGVAPGYLNKPDLTERVFVNDPFTRDGSKMYHTGDLARWLPDGSLELFGRKDQQVKVHGHRIEPGEIEYAVKQMHGIEQAVVITRRDGQGEAQLVCYYVAGVAYDKQIFRDHLEGSLPAYMIPSFFVKIDNIPLTFNGKIDRKALPAISMGADNSRQYIAPATANEIRLARVWAQIFGIPEHAVSTAHNFFDAGGNSLRAIRLLSEIEKQHSVRLSLKDVYNFPTIGKLSTLMENSGGNDGLVMKLSEICPNKKNIFFVPPLIGTSIVFHSMVSRVSKDFNCYGMQYRGFDGDEPFDNSIEEIAQRLVNELFNIQQQGEFIIAGYSMGAIVAYEMAKLVELSGHSCRIILIDSKVSAKIHLTESQDKAAGQIGANFKKRLQELNITDAIDHERAIKLAAHNYSLLSGSTMKGQIKGAIIALEAKDGDLKTDMDDWRSFTNGPFHHEYINGIHDTVLENINIERYVSI